MVKAACRRYWPLALLGLIATSVSAQVRTGLVDVRGRELLRDGQPWIPHGFYQIAFEVAPGNLAHADHPFWANAQKNYTPQEYRYMREAGADSVRIQIAEAGADPRNPLYDEAFYEKALGPWRQQEKQD